MSENRNYPPKDKWAYGWDKGFTHQVAGTALTQAGAQREAGRLKAGFVGMPVAFINPVYKQWCFERMRELDELMEDFGKPSEYIVDNDLREVYSLLSQAYVKLNAAAGHALIGLPKIEEE